MSETCAPLPTSSQDGSPRDFGDSFVASLASSSDSSEEALSSCCRRALRRLGIRDLRTARTFLRPRALRKLFRDGNFVFVCLSFFLPCFAGFFASRLSLAFRDKYVTIVRPRVDVRCGNDPHEKLKSMTVHFPPPPVSISYGFGFAPPGSSASCRFASARYMFFSSWICCACRAKRCSRARLCAMRIRLMIISRHSSAPHGSISGISCAVSLSSALPVSLSSSSSLTSSAPSLS